MLEKLLSNLPIIALGAMNRLTQKNLIQSCLKVNFFLGLYTTMQKAYTCLFGNEVSKVVNLDY